MDEACIDMSDDKAIDLERIKELTLNKMKPKKKFCFKRAMVIAASIMIVASITVMTTYALAGPALRSFIQKSLGLEVGEVVLVGESVSSSDYCMTVEDFVYDGINGEATVSVTALTSKAKKHIHTKKFWINSDILAYRHP